MIESVQALLDASDVEFRNYLERNKSEIFRTMIVGEPLPKDVFETVAALRRQRDIVCATLRDLKDLLNKERDGAD